MKNIRTYKICKPNFKKIKKVGFLSLPEVCFYIILEQIYEDDYTDDRSYREIQQTNYRKYYSQCSCPS